MPHQKYVSFRLSGTRRSEIERGEIAFFDISCGKREHRATIQTMVQTRHGQGISSWRISSG